MAVVIDFSKYMNQILEIDPRSHTAGLSRASSANELRHAAHKFGLTFPVDPATHKYCTLGGMIGNISCGVHSMMGGKTVDNVEELEILTYDGLHSTLNKPDPSSLKSILTAPAVRRKFTPDFTH